MQDLRTPQGGFDLGRTGTLVELRLEFEVSEHLGSVGFWAGSLVHKIESFTLGIPSVLDHY